mmetsp:Transcript_30202/g.92378  ORF Transcript_30202/g.92378 Transcript_30202/m.92378 type:complete len:315 (-) Transcript_30202:139-1083(-)
MADEPPPPPPYEDALPTASVVEVVEEPDDLAARVQRMQQTLKLPNQIVRDLLKVSGTTDLIVVADDSRSMNAVADTGDVAKLSTYWQELVEVMYQLVTMLLVIENDGGFWLKFLNDEQYYHVANKDQLDPIFAGKPKAYGGSTPLRASLEPILRGNYGGGAAAPEEAAAAERDTLCIVLTDGVPTDCSFGQLAQVIREKPTNTYVSFVMCTEALEVVDKYNRTIDPIPGTDVTDDYISEKNEARRVGNDLTRVQWLAKMLLVKFDHFDHLDEVQLSKKQRSQHLGAGGRSASDVGGPTGGGPAGEPKPLCCTVS